jgi:TetR/AcrR family transcriptional repressor of nem operon
VAEYSSTQSAILDVAQELVQTRGYNAFSFRDVADRVGIRSASIHHHYRTKSDLGVAMLIRYRAGFSEALTDIAEQHSEYEDALHAFSVLFADTLDAKRMCLCGTLAVEFETLSPEMQSEVRGFFVESEDWLEKLFAAAHEAGRIRTCESPRGLAATFLSTVEGAMMCVRAVGDEGRLWTAVNQFKRQIEREC